MEDEEYKKHERTARKIGKIRMKSIKKEMRIKVRSGSKASKEDKVNKTENHYEKLEKE